VSDYISKSALLKHLWDWRLQECPVGVCDEETETYKTICECIKAVEEQPTLDEKEIIRKPFERVVERLEENAQKMSEAKAIRPYAKHSPADHRYYKAISVKKAIEIVKEECGINE